VTLDMGLWLIGVLMEVAVIALLVSRCVYRDYPAFFVYSVWGLASDVVGIALQRLPGSHYNQWYLFELPIDLFLQFGVLVELAWSVLRPFRNLLPRWTVFAIIALIALAAAAIWPFARIPNFAALPLQWNFIARLQQTSSILRVLFFLGIAGCSQVLAIGWRNRELQIATGLGFYSLVTLAATALQKRQANSDRYHLLDLLISASYFCSLLYWVVSFAQKEAARREISPKMQSIVRNLAGTTRIARVALAESSDAKGPKR